MKKIILILLMVWGVAKAQCDSVVVATTHVTSITFNSGQLTWVAPTGAVNYNIYVYDALAPGVPVFDAFTAGTTIAITGLAPAHTYKVYIQVNCGVGGVFDDWLVPTAVFTTLANALKYTDQRTPTQLGYIKIDSGVIIPRGLPTLGRQAPLGGALMFNTVDSLVYVHDGLRWKRIAVDSAGIIEALNHKVDSVTVNTDSLFYWINGVAYGQVLPIVQGWSTLGNAGTDPTVNFLGTTDGQDLVIKTNGVERARFTTNGAIQMGGATIASGNYAVSMGISTESSGIGAVAMGVQTLAFGESSVAMGTETQALGINSVAMGNQSATYGDNSFALGDLSASYANTSNALGVGIYAKNYGGTGVGLWNDTTGSGSLTAVNPANKIFQVGNGTANGSRSNAMTILQNGNTGIGVLAPTATLHVNGDVLFTNNTYTNGFGAISNSGTAYIGDRNGSLNSIYAEINDPLKTATLSTDTLKLFSLKRTTNAADSMVTFDPVSHRISYRTIPTGSTTTPAGSNTQIQYNNSGAFGASSAFTYDGSKMTINGSGNIASLGNTASATWTNLGTMGSSGINAIFGGYANTSYFGQNVYYNGSSFVNPDASLANSMFLLQSGNFTVYNTASAGTGLGSQRFTVEAGGNVVLGAVVGTAQLHTTGTVRFANFGAGAATFDASGNVSSTSDERLKTIQGYSRVGLREVMNLRPIIYKWNGKSNNETDSSYTGFSAQNVKANIPNGTGVTKDGYLTLQDRAVLAAAINAIHDLKKIIDQQQKQINRLKRKK